MAKSLEVQDLIDFIEYEKNISYKIRGGVKMYDVHSVYKYMCVSELLDYFLGLRGVECKPLFKSK